MKKTGIRKQAIEKLIIGLQDAKTYAENHNASIPKSWKYTTGKTDYYIYQNENHYTITAIYYDGHREHKTIEA